MAVPPLPPRKTAIVKADAPAKVVRRGVLEPHMVPVAQRLAAQGLPLPSIAGALGIHKRTLQRWVDEGLQEGCTDPLLQEFAAAFVQGRSNIVGEMVEVMRQHALTDWKAAHAILQTVDPETFSLQTRTKVDLTVEAKPVKDLSGLDTEDLLRLAELEAEASAIEAKAKK